MLQTYIPYTPKSATLINEKIAMDSKDGEVIFYTATGPFYSFKCDDKVGKRLAQGIIVTKNLANTAELARALGINQSTVYRNAEIFRDKGASGFFDDRLTRSPYRFTKDKQRIVKALLDKGFTLAAAAAEVGVSEGSVRHALKKGTIERQAVNALQDPSNIEMKGPSERAQEDVSSPIGIAVKRDIERVMASNGALEEAAPEFSANESVHYAGVLLALPFLSSSFYLETGKKIYGVLRNGYYGLQSILLTLAFMAFLRIKNPEQLKNGKTGDFGIVLGLDRCPETKTLRRKLTELGVRGKSIEFLSSLTQLWVEQDDELIGFSYIDGHVRPYHGRKHALPKTHVARRRLCMPATTDFWVNGKNGDPVFFVTTEANDSLLSTVEQEIIPELKRLSKDGSVTLIFDREGWSPKRFFKWEKSGVYVITYRKGNYEPWPEDNFVEVSSEVRGEPVSYKLGQRSIQIGQKGWLREVRRLCNNGHQTSIITTRHDLSMEEVARRMFFRWNQENYFKYMRAEYSLDHLVSRDVEKADTGRLVPNPQKKALKKERAVKLVQLKNKKADYASKAVDNDESRCRTMRGFNISNSGLKSEIQRLEKEVEDLDLKIKALPARVPIRELIEDNKIIRFETEKKRLTDTIKMACYRVETAMMNFIVQSQDFPWSIDEGRSFMKDVFRHPADIIPDHDQGTLTIRFYTMSTWRDNKGLSQLCKVVNKEKFLYPGTDLRMVFIAPEIASEIG
jgi:transposase-like protein